MLPPRAPKLDPGGEMVSRFGESGQQAFGS